MTHYGRGFFIKWEVGVRIFNSFFLSSSFIIVVLNPACDRFVAIILHSSLLRAFLFVSIYCMNYTPWSFIIFRHIYYSVARPCVTKICYKFLWNVSVGGGEALCTVQLGIRNFSNPQNVGLVASMHIIHSWCSPIVCAFYAAF